MSANNVQMGRINFDKECYLASEKLYKAWMTKGDTEKGDILITSEAPLGNIAKVPDSSKYILSQRVMLLRPKKTVLGKIFLGHLMQSNLFQNELLRHSSGSTVLGIKQKLLVKIQIGFPCLDEQKKIAKILTSVDKVIELTEIEIEKLKNLKKGMMQDLLTKGIGHTKFKDSPIGKIPEDWKVLKLQELCDKIVDGTHFTPKYTSEGIPFLRVTDVQSKHINFEKIKYISKEEHDILCKRVRPKRGDILYSKNGTIGIAKMVNWDWDFSIFVSLALIRAKDLKEINRNYLFQILTGELVKKQIKKRSKQGAITNLHLEEMREFDIPVPSIEEQLRISNILLSVDGNISNKKSKLSNLKNLKKGLMQDLLTGKVRVKL